MAAVDLEEGLAIGEKIARERFGVPVPGKLDLLAVPNALLTLPKVVG
jgi:hypothetical protein